MERVIEVIGTPGMFLGKKSNTERHRVAEKFLFKKEAFFRTISKSRIILLSLECM